MTPSNQGGEGVESLLENGGGKTGCRRPFLILNLGTLFSPHAPQAARLSAGLYRPAWHASAANGSSTILGICSGETGLKPSWGARQVRGGWENGGYPRGVGTMGNTELRWTHWWVLGWCERCHSLKKLILLIYSDPKPPQPLPNTTHRIPAHLPEEKVQPQSSNRQWWIHPIFQINFNSL